MDPTLQPLLEHGPLGVAIMAILFLVRFYSDRMDKQLAAIMASHEKSIDRLVDAIKDLEHALASNGDK